MVSVHLQEELKVTKKIRRLINDRDQPPLLTAYVVRPMWDVPTYACVQCGILRDCVLPNCICGTPDVPAYVCAWNPPDMYVMGRPRTVHVSPMHACMV